MSTKTESCKQTKEILDLQTELAQAKADAEAWNRSYHEANTERLRLRAALENLSQFNDSAWVRHTAKDALADALAPAPSGAPAPGTPTP